MTEIELELTYLAKSLPKEIQGVEPIQMVDMYIPKSGIAHPTLRLRKLGDIHEITKKSPVDNADASRQYEHTIKLNKLEYDALAKAGGLVIEKNRYQVYINGYQAEVDVFGGKLSGLVVIDFEFATNDEKNAFLPPSVCLKNITQEPWCAGGYLAGKSYDDIADKLLELGYEPII